MLEPACPIPQLIVPDNSRALVTQANRYEPLLTDTVVDFARHYGCSVLPARAYHPQDKAKATGPKRHRRHEL